MKIKTVNLELELTAEEIRWFGLDNAEAIKKFIVALEGEKPNLGF